MKSILYAALCTVVFMAMSCQQSTETKHDHASTPAATADTTTHAVAAESTTKKITPLYAGLDAKLSGVLTEAIGHYFQLKNALVDDNATSAAKGAKAMAASLQQLDKSYFTADQKKAYDAIEKGLKDHATQIAASNDIKVQRTHFVDLSNNVYELVKAFGAGKTVYHDYCPMANDDKGALWVSEINDIKNPYFGASMLTCGSVEEEIN
jgi:hypothetical protein